MKPSLSLNDKENVRQEAFHFLIIYHLGKRGSCWGCPLSAPPQSRRPPDAISSVLRVSHALSAPTADPVAPHLTGYTVSGLCLVARPGPRCWPALASIGSRLKSLHGVPSPDSLSYLRLRSSAAGSEFPESAEILLQAQLFDPKKPL